MAERMDSFYIFDYPQTSEEMETVRKHLMGKETEESRKLMEKAVVQTVPQDKGWVWE